MKKFIAKSLSAAAIVAMATVAQAADTIKVGVLHSLSGTMAISETTLKDTVLMLIEEQNKKGGVLGKKLEPVVVDPASNWPLFAEKMRGLLTKDKVDVTFGCWTSVSRKSVLPVVEELNGLLFYPVQYEGEESSKNVFYTGASPNQQAIPAVDYLMNEIGVKRWVLAGTDYVYPRTTNKILESYLKAKGVPAEDIMINYTPFGHSDWQSIVSDIKKFGNAGKKTAVVSTINGEANSVSMLDSAKIVAKEIGIKIVEAAAPKSSDVMIAAKQLVGKVNAIYCPIDNTIISAVESVIKVGIDAQVPVFAGDTSTVERGAIAAVGYNYFDLGRQTGDIVLRILKGEKAGSIDVKMAIGTDLYVNPKMAKKMGIEIPKLVLEKATKIIK